ncbi:MAG: ParB/RepB/Spo0J family partition protein [Bacilli bacterium]|nr:ParB/RepB/Spo0J family partition protein [Bacilli bacterium]
MENKKRALGRGLEQLFNNENLDINSISTIEKRIYEDSSKEEIIELELSELRVNPYQPRKVFDTAALQELAESIKEHGVFQPIIVKKSIKGYDIIAGERRVRASKLAGLTKIPAIIRDFTDEQMMEIALLENLQRENLNAIEEAEAYQAMLTKLGLTQEELSKKVGKSRSHITNLLGILRLPNEVRQMVSEGKLSMSHARVLSKLESDDQIVAFANKIKEEKLPVREIEKLTENKEVEKKIKVERKSKSHEYRYVEDMLRDKFDTKVKIKENKIEISFINSADLNRILEVLDVKE